MPCKHWDPGLLRPSVWYRNIPLWYRNVPLRYRNVPLWYRNVPPLPGVVPKCPTLARLQGPSPGQISTGLAYLRQVRICEVLRYARARKAHKKAPRLLPTDRGAGHPTMLTRRRMTAHADSTGFSRSSPAAGLSSPRVHQPVPAQCRGEDPLVDAHQRQPDPYRHGRHRHRTRWPRVLHPLREDGSRRVDVPLHRCRGHRSPDHSRLTDLPRFPQAARRDVERAQLRQCDPAAASRRRLPHHPDHHHGAGRRHLDGG